MTEENLIKDIELLKKNGITVDKGMICLGSKFSFDFTQIQKLNGWYQNNVARLEEQNRLFRQIIQDVLNDGKLYHHQKKKLKEMGFTIA